MLETDKKYQIIYADPAWSYSFSAKNGQKNITGCANQHYNTMTVKDICNLPIKELADKDCVLFIWGTMPLLKECFEVINAWGFKYKTCAFSWVKLNKDGTPFTGMGFWTRSNMEICLLAVKGKPKRVNASVPQAILSVIGEHSAKPHEIYSRIEKLMGKLPRIELFARHKREGWDTWGNQVPKDTQKLL